MIESLINDDRAELTQGAKKAAPVVLSTRIRLARNLTGPPFPERADVLQRRDVLTRCADQISAMPLMKKGTFFDIADLSVLEKQVLMERHLISRELCDGEEGTGVYINKGQTCSVMIINMERKILPVLSSVVMRLLNCIYLITVLQLLYSLVDSRHARP